MVHSVRRLLVNVLSATMGVNGRQRLSVLIYHRVLPQRDYMRIDDPTVRQFDWQMLLLSRYFHPMSMQQALEDANCEVSEPEDGRDKPSVWIVVCTDDDGDEIDNYSDDDDDR